ncbi:MAG: hypothetical protein ABI459_00565, partial [Deltaproteobacteria bacterium]
MADERWVEPSQPATHPLTICIRHIAPSPDRNLFFGDHFFAVGLADAFVALGHRVRVDARSQWDDPMPEGAIVIVLRGPDPRPGPAHTTSLLWYIYPDAKFMVRSDEFKGYAHVFVASDDVSDVPQFAALRDKMSVLYQAFDPRVMYLEQGAVRADTVFIGNNHRNVRNVRQMMNFANEIAHPVRLWGRFWADLPANVTFQGLWLGNADVGNVYRHAQVVLCDHVVTMRHLGFTSNRIFDALACGAAIVSDQLPSLPEGFERFVTRCETVEDFRTAVETIKSEG